jgi:hypothetical protein
MGSCQRFRVLNPGQCVGFARRARSVYMSVRSKTKRGLSPSRHCDASLKLIEPDDSETYTRVLWCRSLLMWLIMRILNERVEPGCEAVRGGR